MADDIVTELREWGGDGDGSEYDIEDAVPCSMLRDAADKIERLCAVVDAIDALHSRKEFDAISQQWYCAECNDYAVWPCATHRLLHPEEADRGYLN